jgi:hypothetical protein
MLYLRYETVDSKSRPGVKHTVTIVDWVRPVACTCEDWKFKIRRIQPYACIHMKGIVNKAASDLEKVKAISSE